MNQRFDPNDKRPANPTSWSADGAARADETGAPRTAAIDPITGTPLGDPLVQRTLDPAAPPVRSGRSSWPVLIILLAGLVLAMLVWLPAEMSNDASDTAIQPAPASETATPPADAPAATGAPAATPPAAVAPAETAPAAPATPPASTAPAPAATSTAPQN